MSAPEAGFHADAPDFQSIPLNINPFLSVFFWFCLIVPDYTTEPDKGQHPINRDAVIDKKCFLMYNEEQRRQKSLPPKGTEI